jgi:hypothetical protein
MKEKNVYPWMYVTFKRAGYKIDHGVPMYRYCIKINDNLYGTIWLYDKDVQEFKKTMYVKIEE